MELAARISDPTSERQSCLISQVSFHQLTVHLSCGGVKKFFNWIPWLWLIFVLFWSRHWKKQQTRVQNATSAFPIMRSLYETYLRIYVLSAPISIQTLKYRDWMT